MSRSVAVVAGSRRISVAYELPTGGKRNKIKPEKVGLLNDRFSTIWHRLRATQPPSRGIMLKHF